MKQRIARSIKAPPARPINELPTSGTEYAAEYAVDDVGDYPTDNSGNYATG